MLVDLAGQVVEFLDTGPLLVIDGIGEALEKTDAKVIYVANLVSKKGQTDNFTVSEHAAEIERFAGRKVLDYVLYNHQTPTEFVAKRYKEEGGFVTTVDTQVLQGQHYKAMGGDFLGEMAEANDADTLIGKRSLIRHDSKAVAKSILALYENHE
jgi:uncharacterized cofD-like protein